MDTNRGTVDTEDVESEIDEAFNMLDVDGDGRIRDSDLKVLTSRLLTAFGESPTTPRGRAMQASANGMWHLLRATLDRDGDGEISRKEMKINHRFELIAIVNDALIALWFVLGSVLFFYESLHYEGTWLFVLGSIQLLIRPVIRLCRMAKIKRLRAASNTG